MPRRPNNSRWFKRYNPWLKKWMDKNGMLDDHYGWVSKSEAKKLMKKALVNCSMWKAFAEQQADDYVKNLK